MIELNPFLQSGALRNRTENNAIPKRSSEEKAMAVARRHRIEDYAMAKRLGLQVEDLYK